MKKQPIKLLQGLLLSSCLLGTVQAATYTEVGDAGELLGTAEVPSGVGALTNIYGYLGENGGQGDVDLYRIMITDPAAFSVTVSASLSADNDAIMYLFDAEGNFRMDDDEAGVGHLPGFLPGMYSTGWSGVHYLAFTIFINYPLYTNGVLSGWEHFPAPLQSGNYNLTLTGATFAAAPSAVPVPAAAWLLGSGLVGLIGIGRRKQAA